MTSLSYILKIGITRPSKMNSLRVITHIYISTCTFQVLLFNFYWIHRKVQKTYREDPCVVHALPTGPR